MKLTTTQIDWLNIALMFIAAAAAWVLPFEVFLFSYAVLGPLHYLTEISWLHERSYFTTGKRDALVLLLLGIVLFVMTFVIPYIWPLPKHASDQVIFAYKTQMERSGAVVIYLAFMAALATTAFVRLGSKLLFMLLAGLFLMAFMKAQFWVLLFAVFLPTLIHVYVFTSAFMLLGALKSRSIPGLLALVLLLAIGSFLLFYRPNETVVVSDQVRDHYNRLFVELNRWIAKLFGQSWTKHDQAYQTALGISLMRFIAFAYTYHYLNWFSKTSVIKWHQVNGWRLATILALWIVAVGLYWWNYLYGFIALYTLSFLHVFLEFPLNWRSFMDLGKEVTGLARHGWNRQPQHPPGKQLIIEQRIPAG